MLNNSFAVEQILLNFRVPSDQGKQKDFVQFGYNKDNKGCNYSQLSSVHEIFKSAYENNNLGSGPSCDMREN